MNRYHQLIENGSVEVGVKLETSFIEIKNEYTLWGLLVNSGYLTISQSSQNAISSLLKWVRIPNEEVKSEFQTILAEQANISPSDLELMFQYLLREDMVHFLEIYQNIVLSCISYFDAKENSYHMLFLGMCISLRNLYKVTSNIEAGHGRHDIRLEAMSKGNMHLIIEFKQGEEVDELKEEALQQILDNKYYTGLDGEVLCLGVAHNKKNCAIAYKKVSI